MGCSVLPSPFFPLLLTERQGLGEGGRNSRKRPAIWCRCGWQSGRSLQQASNSGLPWDLLVVPLRLLWDPLYHRSPSQGQQILRLPSDGHHQLLPQWPPSALAPMTTISSCPNGHHWLLPNSHHQLLPQWPTILDFSHTHTVSFSLTLPQSALGQGPSWIAQAWHPWGPPGSHFP